MLTPAHIERYCVIRADSFRHGGCSAEELVIFCEQVERRLEKLDGQSKSLLMMQGMGYTQREIGVAIGMSLRTVSRKCRCLNRAVFADFMDLVSRSCQFRPAYIAGRRSNGVH